ncbi:hypothetical protein Y032_0019g3794 [Ancylostoma ceylanicum]|uniref:Uncharacterized protein n=1 Tax=Ancylostoma ceylanicum TaxID=53326 RepID=A0A016V147_9BILA|nr:hypothetical protein Y032_0019g3794 [Ancylostoma ceylanicum]
MADSGSSARKSLGSSITSEFEVLSGERSTAGGNAEGNDHHDDVPPAPMPLSISVPHLETPARERDLSSETSALKSLRTIDEYFRTSGNPVFRMSDSCVSELSSMGKETMGMLEQLLNELLSVKERSKLLEQKAEIAEQSREMSRRLEEENRILLKSLVTASSKVEQLIKENEELRQKLSSCSKNEGGVLGYLFWIGKRVGVVFAALFVVGVCAECVKQSKAS